MAMGISAMLCEIGPSRFKHGQRIVLDFDANPNELHFKNNSSGRFGKVGQVVLTAVVQ
jgi:hypothetical protein